ncbi:MAG: hypothetical protein LQ352_002676 [Teloschistes flavicans]|nr:MAG: hypothetical protein LQ352_002676 [Teloschistes flavicans]
MITPNQGHALESSGQADRCVDESSNHERDMTSAQDNVQDEYSSGSNILRKNHTETPCEGKCSLVRECRNDCGDKTVGSGSQAGGTACITHKKRTREKYAAKLAALDCICRALIALGQESCCITQEQPSPRKRRDVRSTSGNAPILSDLRNTKLEVQDSARARGCGPPAQDFLTESTSRFAGRATETGDGGNDPINVVHAQTGFTDVENRSLGVEHVALSITGMTCTGCETKLGKVLGNLPAITNLKTSLVMTRAEFSLDTASMSLESVMKHLERTTEFTCERISTQGSNLDVVPCNVNEFLDQSPTLGVKDMQLVSKGVVRINFDPRIVGARSLIEENAKNPCQLAPPPPDPGLAAGSKHVRNMGCMTLLSIVLTIPVLILTWAPLQGRPIVHGAISLAFASVVQFVVAGPFYPKALKSLIFSRMIEMDLLIILSTSAAYIFSVVSFGSSVAKKPLSTGQFFETSTLLVTLIMIGRWIAALSRQKAVESISMRSLQSPTAHLATHDGTNLKEIDSRLLQYGDVFCVLPELRVPTDRVVLSGCSEIDESMLTGESRPVAKGIGSKVIAGSINGSGKLVVRLTHIPGENTVSVIAGMVDNAKLSKPKLQELADRIATYLVPLIILLAVITFVIWVSVGIAVNNRSSSDALIQAITYAITVLIVSCPCAIGLAVPMVIVISSGAAAERGIIFKSAESIEVACKTTHVVFDKTGTITVGKLKVVEEQVSTGDNITRRAMILGLVANSKHPVSAAVAASLEEQGISAANVSEIRTVVGNGVEGKVGGRMIRGGSARWLEVESDPRVQSVLRQGHTLFCVTLDSDLFAVFSLTDTIRPEATATIVKLKQMGIRVSMLSGDDVGAVQHVAAEIGLHPCEARSRCSPSDKQKHIQQLLTWPDGQGKATVIFVGDGTNDAVALAEATVGVHLDSGTDVAQSAADVVFMRPCLESVLTMIEVSRAAVHRIQFNFGWSFLYNTVALLFASGALAKVSKGATIKIPPEYAGLGELVSVLPVIAIAVSLKWARFTRFLDASD